MSKTPEPPSDTKKAASTITSRADESDLLRHECQLIRTAYAILLWRRRRLDQFQPEMFGEPAWDMLLEVYVRENSGLSLTNDELQMTAATPQSTAERWLRYLESEGLIARPDRPHDTGIKFVELTDLGRHALDAYLESMLNLLPDTATASR